jgi:polyisoprenoid-binding protein YceI
MTTTDTTIQTSQIPGYRPGSWAIDPVHSEAGFVVRHLMVSKVRGRFSGLEGVIELGDDPLDSKVDVVIDAASVDTANPDRDAHVRAPDFLDVEQYPTLEFHSTSVRSVDDAFVVDGELTLRGVTRPVELRVEINGFQASTPFGDSRVGFSATTEINRKDYGVEFNAPLEGGGFALGDKVQIALEIEAILQQDS